MELLRAHRATLEKVTEELLRRETLSGDEFYALIGVPRPPGRTPGKDIGPSGLGNGKLVDEAAASPLA
jgi:hypothetical protein